MKPNNRAVLTCALALAAFVSGFYSPAEAQQTPSAAVACYFVGRVFLNSPVNGQGEVVGYFTNINGIPGPLFNGTPGEKTAFFTFRSDVLLTTSLPSNGDIGLSLVSAGAFNIYYNPTPNGDWSNPDSFSGGQKFPGQPIAHFMRPESLLLQILQTDSANPPPFESITLHALTETLVSSQSFTFKGHKYDFSALVPGGVTLNETASNTGVPGVAGFPIGSAYAGHCLAVGSADQDRQ